MLSQCSLNSCRVVCALVLSLAIGFCTAIDRQPSDATNYYLHGTDWRQGMCASRERQSPVNFDTLLKAPPTVSLHYKYDPISNIKIQLQAGGGMLFVDMSQQMFGGLTYGNDWYPLVRIDFHGPAEHTIRGVRNPLEIQLLHRKLSDPTEQIIVSVLVWCENAPGLPDLQSPADQTFYPPDAADVDFNRQLQHFLTVRTPDVDGSAADIQVPANPVLDLNALIGNDAGHASGDNTFLLYSGSFTSPPCSDHALWLVRRKTIVASDAQVKALADALNKLTANRGSYREIMPMNKRPVKVAQLLMTPPDETLKVKRDVRLPWGPNPRTDGEFQAGREAEKVRAAAEQSVRYTADLARRLRRSDRKYAERLNTADSKAEFAHMGETNATHWMDSVSRVRAAITGGILGVSHATDAAVRAEVVGIHNEAVQQAEIASHMQF